MMNKTNDDSYMCKGLSILEMVIALAIMAIVFGVVLPQFRNV